MIIYYTNEYTRRIFGRNTLIWRTRKPQKNVTSSLFVVLLGYIAAGEKPLILIRGIIIPQIEAFFFMLHSTYRPSSV